MGMIWWNSIDQLARVSTWVQWFLVAFAFGTACLTVAKLVIGNRLDELKAEKAVAQAAQLHATQENLRLTQDTLRATQDKLGTLEASQQPRRLIDEQTARLRAELHHFSKQRIDISAHPDDHESLNFAFEIQKALMAAGWQAAGVGASTFHAKPGIWIWYQPGSKAEVAAKRLIALLQEFGFQINVMEGISDKELILLSTGRKKD
jgi:hypothetical protein